MQPLWHFCPTYDPLSTLEVQLHRLWDFKVTLVLTATGGAPNLRVNKYRVDGTERIAHVTLWLRQFLKTSENQTLYLYVNNFVTPQPDDCVADLFSALRTGPNLRLSYSYAPAFH
eukprot:GHVT01045212.1.p1 GENE.GHVT01045212.1~~GHVT01045212.1.p1  ORF type:complete len:115 (+),score=1.15 GHVT01045212.1:1835-2179(+)